MHKKFFKLSWRSKYIILKSPQNVWSYPKSIDIILKSIDIILKSAQISSNYPKSEQKSINIILKNAQKIFEGILNVHEDL